MEINKQAIIDFTDVGTCVVIPSPSEGHIHLTHPNSQFKLLLDKEQLFRFLESAKPFAECRFKDDYIILQIMQHEETGGTLVEFLKFGNLSGRFTDPTTIDNAPWISARDKKPMENSSILVYVVEPASSVANGTVRHIRYSEKVGFETEEMKAEGLKALFWKPLDPPVDFCFNV